uniref:Uncharacterized protein n=1 Tax=Otus sunia TaxID=257818 RepID=A0A8C8B1I2_9STRI
RPALGWSCLLIPQKSLLCSLLILSWGDKDFPPTAAPMAHQRPQPCLEKLPLHINQLIQQEEPRV